MLITKEVEITINVRNIKHYESKGYIIPREFSHGRYSVKRGTKIIVDSKDLTDCSTTPVEVLCDNKNCENPKLQIKWQSYKQYIKPNAKYYCTKCMRELFSGENIANAKLKNSKSFAQWGINNLGEDFLERYWDYEKNDELEISPWKISYGSKRKIWIKCQEKEYHNSYYVTCFNFCNGNRCPECNEPKGERVISKVLINNNIENISQKTFENLVGINNGLLSYDYYLPKYNLLIEFQGIQHEKPIDFKGRGKKYANEQFIIQQEHDRRKREYAENKNIKLLEIWYYDLDNIEEILSKELMILKEVS